MADPPPPQMNNTLYYISRTISAILYPMFIPTYGILIYFLALRQLIVYPAPLIWIGVIGTFVFTCLLPLSVVLVMIHRGNLTDIYIRNPKQRTMPYIYSTICYGFWAYFCWQVMHLPLFIVLTAAGATVALLLVLLINYTWKISAHLAALGGLFGGMMSFSLSTGISATWSLVACSVVALLLMFARVYDGSHTPLQVVCGYLLGTLATFIPNLIVESL
ncbi:MAG: phosphatase PAP2 family protein [Paludibacteraceae bacterium]|nr:phosphatase PAP2 family protein [Paludibacteraceae bacterium]